MSDIPCKSTLYWRIKCALSITSSYTPTFQRDIEACSSGGQGQKQNKLQAPCQPHHPLLVKRYGERVDEDQQALLGVRKAQRT